MTDCDFCGKSQREVARLVASAKGTAICDECVILAVVAMSGSGIRIFNPKDFNLRKKKTSANGAESGEG